MPSIKYQVIEFIFKEVIVNNNIFKDDDGLVKFIIEKTDLQMYKPEEVIIRQGEKPKYFFMISNGELDVGVADL